MKVTIENDKGDVLAIFSVSRDQGWEMSDVCGSDELEDYVEVLAFTRKTYHSVTKEPTYD